MTDLLLQVLANSLWVGLATAGVAAAACACVRDAASRHWICCFALAAALFVPLGQLAVPSPAAPVMSVPALLMVHAPAFPPESARMDWSWLAWAWLFGATGFTSLLAVRIARAVAAKRAAVWVSPELLLRRNGWRAGMPMGRDGELLASSTARSPFAVGWLTPAVVFPEDLPSRLEDADLRRLWLHESAHLRRFDDWTAVAVEAVGALLFYHPAAWWLRRRIAAEREFACDELAARSAGSVADYALTLTRFAELQLPRHLAGGLGFAGGPGLKRRITMLLDHRRQNGARRPVWAIGLSALGLAALLTLGPKITLAQQEPAAPPAPPAPAVEVQLAPPVRPVAPVPPVAPVADEVELQRVKVRQKELLQSLSDVQTQLELTNTPELQQQLRAMEIELHELTQQSVQRSMTQSQAERMRQSAEAMRQAMPSDEMREQMEANGQLMQAEAEKMREQMQQFQVEMQRAQQEMQQKMQENASAFEAEAERSQGRAEEFQREMERAQREMQEKQEQQEKPKAEPELF